MINATGPKLNFGATPGLGPDGNSLSVCTAGHATEAARGLAAALEKMRVGQHQTLVVATGHGTCNCTCEDAAFEYAFKFEHEPRQASVCETKSGIYHLTNEHELGDLGAESASARRSSSPPARPGPNRCSANDPQGSRRTRHELVSHAAPMTRKATKAPPATTRNQPKARRTASPAAR